MDNQRRTIIGACDYSIATMQNLKRDLQDLGAKNQELNWAIGGIVAALASNLFRICDLVFMESIADGTPNARDDLEQIRSRFNAFIDGMINHE